MHEPRPRPKYLHDIDPVLSKILTADEPWIVAYLFSGAYVVDIDFSAWQRSITLYLVSHHASEMRGYYPEVFAVEFERVRQWNVTFQHLERSDEELGDHFYWNIWRYSAERLKQGVEISLWGGEVHPRLVIVCEKIAIRELPGYLLAQAVPNRPESEYAFLRPDIEQIVRNLEK